MLFQRRYRPLIGLDITTSSIKLIELTKSGDGYRVESYAAEPSPPNSINEKAIVDAQSVGDAVRRAVKRAGARSKEVRRRDQRRRGDHQGHPDAAQPAR